MKELAAFYYNIALLIFMAFLLDFPLAFAFRASSDSSASSSRAATSSHNCFPTISASANTRVCTVAPSRRFFLEHRNDMLATASQGRTNEGGVQKLRIGITYPSLRDSDMSSEKAHSLPLASILPVFGQRVGVHSSASRKVDGVRESLLLATSIMPSSSYLW